MEVSIERSDCISCGLCVSTCPDVFRIAEDGSTASPARRTCPL